ncbi:MAG: hypothetical protein H8E60_09600 [Candidatus Marinimicrobia bacterium]|nr:hypothetical protein [Candidatus Neomarinimicrobiota bacterium]
MDLIWVFFGLIILATIVSLWHEFSQKKFGWSKLKYQIYILALMFFSFLGYGLIMVMVE